MIFNHVFRNPDVITGINIINVVCIMRTNRAPGPYLETPARYPPQMEAILEHWHGLARSELPRSTPLYGRSFRITGHGRYALAARDHFTRDCILQRPEERRHIVRSPRLHARCEDPRFAEKSCVKLATRISGVVREGPAFPSLKNR